jgi:hypothetical protein
MIEEDRLNLAPEWMQRLVRQLNYKGMPPNIKLSELMDWCLRNNWELTMAPAPKDKKL